MFYYILKRMACLRILYIMLIIQHRRLSYSRHAVNDRDLSTQVNYKMHMNIRRMMGEHKHRHKRSKKLLKVRLDQRFSIIYVSFNLGVSYFLLSILILQDGKQNHVSFPEFQQQNGSTKLFTQGTCKTSRIINCTSRFS